jgi:hypothetical protein
MAGVEQGYNNDVVFAGAKYHVQTEDWGESTQFVVTRVFQQGAVVRTIKTPYAEFGAGFGFGKQAVRLGMREQHQKVLDQLVSGALLEGSIK